MKKLFFKKWLNEVSTTSGTTASSIAQFKMPIGIGLVRRNWLFQSKKKNKY